MSSSLTILHKKPTPYQGIYDVIIDINDDQNRRIRSSSLDSKDLESSFILKEIPCESSKSSIIIVKPFFMEAMISSTFNCPYLNSSRYCKIEDKYCQLFFDKALGTSRSEKPTLPQINSWCSSLISGLLYLHERRIIHGDIKGSNVLIYEKNAKLSDFGLSTFILDGSIQVFPASIKMYTVTHRPPEVWNGNTWGFAADIWALGCTFYEIIYGHSFFPVQDNNRNYYDCLNDWVEKKKRNSITYNPILLPNEWNNPKYKKINELIMSMIQPNPLLRPTIFQLASIFASGYEFVSSKTLPIPIPNRNPISEIGTTVSLEIGKKRSLAISPDNITMIRKTEYFPIEPISIKHYSILNIPSESFRNRLKSEIINIIQMENTQLIDLIACLFEYVSMTVSDIDIVTVRACTIIIHLICFRITPNFFVYTRDDLAEVYRISNKVRFHYINWLSIYRIQS